jgi:hypothetical protein
MRRLGVNGREGIRCSEGTTSFVDQERACMAMQFTMHSPSFHVKQSKQNKPDLQALGSHRTIQRYIAIPLPTLRAVDFQSEFLSVRVGRLRTCGKLR